jgi:uncharacterized protein YrrD
MLENESKEAFMLTSMHLGVKVTGREGEYLGKLKYLVVSPGSNELTYLIVERGHFDAQDKVVEAKLIKAISNSDRTVQLDLSREEMAQMRDYVKREYVNMGTYSYDRVIFGGEKLPIDGYGGMVYVGSDIDLPTPEPFTEETNLPEGALVFHQGAEVEALDGKLGTIKEVNVDPENGKVISLKVEEGLFFGEELEVPVELVESTSQDCVYLKVNKDEVSKIHHGSAGSLTHTAL